MKDSFWVGCSSSVHLSLLESSHHHCGCSGRIWQPVCLSQALPVVVFENEIHAQDYFFICSSGISEHLVYGRPCSALGTQRNAEPETHKLRDGG